MSDGQFVSLDSDRSACLDRLRNAGSQGRVGTTAIVISDEFANGRTKMPLVHRDDEIQALAPDGPDHTLAESVRGGCSDWCFERADPAVFQGLIGRSGKDGITIVDHESIRMVVRQKFAELLNRPFRCRMAGHIDMENPAGANLHRDEDVKYAEGRTD
jgi:hypothetical protein